MKLHPRALLPVLLGLPLVLLLTGCNKVESITINPTTETLSAVGQTVQYQAIATEQMGSGPTTNDNITNSVTWTSSNPGVATINSTGLATAVGGGITEIIATSSNNVVASAQLTVTLTGTGTTTTTPYITILPSSSTETFVGETTQFTASGNLTGTGSAQNLTSQVVWISSNAQVATINSSGLTTVVGAGTTTIIAEYGGINATASETVTISTTGSGTPTLTVTPSTAAETFTGETTQFLATGNLTGNGSSQNLTSQVSWLSSNVQVATISSTGLATAVGAGTTTITATAGGLIASATLSVTISATGSGTPTLSVTPSSVAESFAGETTQFTATGNLSGIGNTQNLTSQVTWVSSNQQVATITSGGLATAVAAGTTTILAESGGLIASATMTVTISSSGSPTLTVTPNLATQTFVGQLTQFLATGNLTGAGTPQNLTSQVTWFSSNQQVATVSASGVAAAVAAGTTTISAVSGGLIASANLTVTIASSGSATPSMTVTPSSASETFAGETTQFTATGSLTGVGTAQDLTSQVTWISSNQQVATISAGGLASAVAAGTTTIIAQSGGLLATATLAVSITSSGTPNLTITPSSASETFTGETTQFFAVGNLTGVGSSQDLTSVVTWSSSNQQVATISAGGLATATGYGTTVITAKSGALSAVATLNVIQTATTPTTPTLNIIPGSLTFVGQGTGGTSQLLAFGNLVGNGAVKDLTNDVTWTSSDPAVASVSATGLVTSQISPKYGLSYSTTITAVGQTIGGSGSVITSTILVTVNSAITTAPAAAEPTLTIGFTGTITGNVTSAPTPGVNCGNGGAVCAMDYSANTAVTLTETPANGATFSGWSANCTAVTGSPNECTLQMTDSNITVTANYN